MGSYSFDKKRAVLLLTSFIVMGILIFISGWLVAVILYPGEESDIAAAAPDKTQKLSVFQRIKNRLVTVGKNALRTGNLKSAVVQESRKTVSDTKRDIQLTVADAKQKAIKAAETAVTGTPKKPPAEKQKSDEAGTGAADESPSSPKKAADIGKKGETAAENDKPAEKASVSPVMRFSIEVDTYVAESKASDMLKTLTDKGYKAEILKMPGENVLYLVQLGDYADLKSASDAAFEFKEKEGISAVVRPISAALLEEIRKSGKNSPKKE
jgi:cell division septation protein DedD